MTSATDSREGRQLTLSWSEDERVPVRTSQELDEQLDVLDRKARESRPLVAALEHASGAALSIGLGRDRSVLNYMATPDPPYFTSHDPTVDEDGTVVFFYYGHWSEFPADAAVPADQAREAARRFFADGERPGNIDWRMD